MYCKRKRKFCWILNQISYIFDIVKSYYTAFVSLIIWLTYDLFSYLVNYPSFEIIKSKTKSLFFSQPFLVKICLRKSFTSSQIWLLFFQRDKSSKDQITFPLYVSINTLVISIRFYKYYLYLLPYLIRTKISKY